MDDTISGSEVINPETLSAAEKAAFADSLYALHSRIFDGVEKKRFVSYVIDSPAQWNRIRIYKNVKNDWVGYCAVHRFHVPVFNRPCVIVRAEAGILRKYRGRSLTLWFGFAKAIQYRLRHPFSELYYLGTFVHPSVFYMFSRYFCEYYPRVDTPLPLQIKDLMLELAKIFQIKAVRGNNFLSREVGWITKESEADSLFWQKHTHPAVKFYLAANPTYAQGSGLLVLVPLTLSNISRSLTRFLQNKLSKKIANFKP